MKIEKAGTYVRDIQNYSRTRKINKVVEKLERNYVVMFFCTFIVSLQNYVYSNPTYMYYCEPILLVIVLYLMELNFTKNAGVTYTGFYKLDYGEQEQECKSLYGITEKERILQKLGLKETGKSQSETLEDIARVLHLKSEVDKKNDTTMYRKKTMLYTNVLMFFPTLLLITHTINYADITKSYYVFILIIYSIFNYMFRKKLVKIADTKITYRVPYVIIDKQDVEERERVK